jgi:hypothetical protein
VRRRRRWPARGIGAACMLVASLLGDTPVLDNVYNMQQTVILITFKPGALRQSWVGLCAAESPQRSIEQASAEIRLDPVLLQHYAGWDWSQAYYERLAHPMRAHVAYRVDHGPVTWTAAPVTLRAGEVLLCVDPLRCIRQHCCNEVRVQPQRPTLPPAQEPPASYFEPPALPIPPDFEQFPPDTPVQWTGPPLVGDRPPDYWYWVFVPPGRGVPPVIMPPVAPVPVPESGTVWLVGIGLVALAAWRILNAARL